MIGLNPLKTKVLITTDEVIFHGPTDSKVDPRILLQSIIIAETRFIQPMLGATVYNALVEAKNTLVTADNKVQLQTDLNTGRTDREMITLQEGDYVNSDDSLSATQKALWNTYLHKITAECVVFCSLEGNRARFTAKGVTKNFPATIGGIGDTASVDLYELRHLIDRTLQVRINPLLEAMHEYLYSTAYPDYTRKKYSTKRSGIILSMYEDDDDDDKCGCRW